MTRPTQYSAINLFREAHVSPEKWNQMPLEADVARTTAVIQRRGIRVIQVRNAHAALETLQNTIPPNAEVMHGSSTTLIEIGYETLLKSGRSGWKDLHDIITAEDDETKRHELRRRSVTAEYFISGVNAIAQTGEIVACDKSGSRVGAWAFAAKHLILISGVNKIVPTLEDALHRVREYAYPLEDVRARKATGVSSEVGKCVILAHEAIEGRTSLVLIDESLGY